MATPVEKKIGDRVFVIGHIPARKAPKALKQLARVAGPLISEIGKLVSEKGDVDVKAALAGGVLDGVVRKAMEVDDEAASALMLELAEACSVIGMNGKLSTNFDLVFTGNLDQLVEWFVEAIKVNFGGFLPSTKGGSP